MQLDLWGTGKHGPQGVALSTDVRGPASRQEGCSLTAEGRVLRCKQWKALESAAVSPVKHPMGLASPALKALHIFHNTHALHLTDETLVSSVCGPAFASDKIPGPYTPG